MIAVKIWKLSELQDNNVCAFMYCFKTNEIIFESECCSFLIGAYGWARWRAGAILAALRAAENRPRLPYAHRAAVRPLLVFNGD